MSPAKAAANAANAQLSTGPVTAEGKARSSRNALKHGLTSKDLIVREDEKEAFEQLQADLRAQLTPEGALELFTFNHLIHAAWNMQRAQQLETDLHVNGLDPLLDESAAQTLDRIHRSASAERSYYRHLKELRALQTNRVVRDLVLSEEEADACPSLVPCHEFAKRSHQVHNAGAKAEEHAVFASLNRMDAQMDAWLAAARARRMQNEPTASARKDEIAA